MLAQLLGSQFSIMLKKDTLIPSQNGSVWQTAAWVAKGGVVHRDFISGEEQRVVDLILPGKLLNLLLGVEGDAENLDPLIGIGLLKLDQGGYFASTGKTPGCPQVDNQEIAFPVAEIRRLSLQIC